MATRSTGARPPFGLRCIAVGALVAALGAVGPAAAEPARSRADALYADGNAAMARRDAAAAADHYRAAWDLAPQPRIALNLGIALAELGRIAEASEAFAVYLADPASDPAKRPVLEGRLQQWRAELGEITLHIAPAARPDVPVEIEIDGARPLRQALVGAVPVAPGAHRVMARAPGYRASELRVAVAAGERVTARIDLLPLIAEVPPVTPRPAPPPAAVTAPAPPPAAGSHPWKWAALGVGAAAAATGGYFGAVAVRTWRSIDERCPDGKCTSPADLAVADDARRAGTRANIAFGVAGAAVVAAFVLWRLEPRGGPVVSITPHTAGGMLCISGAL